MKEGEYPTKTVCSECGSINTKAPNYCPSCGAESPWEEQPKYEFDEADLPIIIPYSVSRDNYELWFAFTEKYFGEHITGDKIVNLPDEFPSLEYCYLEVYWVITQDFELEGPFFDKSAAREEMG